MLMLVYMLVGPWSLVLIWSLSGLLRSLVFGRCLVFSHLSRLVLWSLVHYNIALKRCKSALGLLVVGLWPLVFLWYWSTTKVH